jgi:hypothetical protein
MSDPNCACQKFRALEGAATQAYISQFLERTGADAGATHYRCRVCGARWERREERGKRPSLVRIESQEPNVESQT